MAIGELKTVAAGEIESVVAGGRLEGAADSSGLKGAADGSVDFPTNGGLDFPRGRRRA